MTIFGGCGKNPRLHDLNPYPNGNLASQWCETLIQVWWKQASAGLCSDCTTFWLCNEEEIGRALQDPSGANERFKVSRFCKF